MCCVSFNLSKLMSINLFSNHDLVRFTLNKIVKFLISHLTSQHNFLQSQTLSLYICFLCFIWETYSYLITLSFLAGWIGERHLLRSPILLCICCSFFEPSPSVLIQAFLVKYYKKLYFVGRLRYCRFQLPYLYCKLLKAVCIFSSMA